MRRLLFVCLVVLIAAVCLYGKSQAAGNYPPRAVIIKPFNAPPRKVVQQKMFYGYVPPAPIRHTWPGGYRAIVSEITNTLVDHILGRY